MVFDNYYNRTVTDYFGNPNIPPPGSGSSYPADASNMLYPEISAHEPPKQSDFFSPKNIGMSAGVMQSITESVNAAIKQGSRKVEIAFFGAGKGSRQGLTPDDFSLQERRDIRELAKVNEMEISTHATAGIAGLAGLSQDRFSEEARKQSLDEVKRAINFAADASTGGAIVVHTGEFPRSIASVTKGKDLQFEHYAEEEKKATHYLVDPKTGGIIHSVREDQEVWVPKQKMDKGETQYLKNQGGDYVYDEFLVQRYGKTDKARIPLYDYDNQGNIQMEKFTYQNWVKDRKKEALDHGRNISDDELVKDFYKFQKEASVSHALGTAKEHEVQYSKALEGRKKIEKALDYYKKVWNSTPEEDRWRLMVKEREFSELIPPDEKNPVKYLQERLNENDRRMAYGRELAISGRKQAHDAMDEIDRATTIYDYGKKKTFESIAEAGIFAMEKTKQAGKALSKPLFVAPENVWPEQFGSHPDELKQIVEGSRKKMADMLIHSKGMSENDAKKYAADHIKATLDVGHLNFWRKYFKADPHLSSEQNEKRFSNWVVNETEKLVKSGTLGNVHLADNFGFNDDHLSLGAGNAPIKEIMNVFKKAGFKDLIVEPGSLNFETSLKDSLGFLDASTYSSGHGHEHGGGSSTSWRNIQNAYFGYVRPPYQVVGSYAPWTHENEGWTPWSQLPFE